MKKLTFVLSLFLILSIFLNVNAQQYFGCGTLAQGVEIGCVGFISDYYGWHLVVGDLNGHSVGDRVQIAGTIDSSCMTTCMQGPCLFIEQIDSCSLQIDDCGILVQGVEIGCILFDSDDYGSYLVYNVPEPFNIGDRVNIAGTIDPYCYTTCMQGDGCLEIQSVTYCDYNCCNIRGDANHSGNTNPDVEDAIFLVNYLFKGGQNPPCWLEADIDNSGSSEINVADIVRLVDYLFRGFAPPPVCPE